ncbi:MAG: SAM-dependent methyltransferase [Balneolaceae bacterium]|nr:SAM-dependent methyltransferase [Balneolaceae bacterium]
MLKPWLRPMWCYVIPSHIPIYSTMFHPVQKRIYVGKRAGSSQNSQTNTNELIIQKARQNKCVVRLKGGDPFIFGRGHEEMEHARKHGIPVEVVPGISSCTSVGELQNIPLTKEVSTRASG